MYGKTKSLRFWICAIVNRQLSELALQQKNFLHKKIFSQIEQTLLEKPSLSPQS